MNNKQRQGVTFKGIVAPAGLAVCGYLTMCGVVLAKAAASTLLRTQYFKDTFDLPSLYSTSFS